MNIPIVELHLKGMEQTICVAISEEMLKIDADIKAAVSDACKPENVKRIIRNAVDHTLRNALENTVRDYYQHGKGRQRLMRAIEETLEQKNV